jgi:hypothetical protein
MGILILVVLVVGLATMVLYTRDIVMWMYRKAFGLPTMRAQEKGKTRKIWLDYEYLDWEKLPKYKGETGWFGLAKYRDVVVPDNHHYSTVAYMDTAVKQYFYDVMAGWKDNASYIAEEGKIKFWGTFLAFPLVFALKNWIAALVIVTAFVLIIVFLAKPAGIRAGRRSAERSKNLTPADWRDVYREVAESQSRVDEMRRAGVGRYYVRGRHP